MSKIVSKFSLAAGVALAMALTFSCSNAQAADNEKRILGTWVEVGTGSDNPCIWIFNSDGTGKYKYDNSDNHRNFEYGVTSDRIAIATYETYVSDLSISNDGKTAIIKNRIRGNYGNGHLLRKNN